MEIKICTRCKKSKPLDEFPKDRRRADGRFPWCKLCKRAVYHEQYREASILRCKERHARNRGAENAQSKAYYAENREVLRRQIRANNHRRYWSDPEKSREDHRADYHRRKRGEDEVARFYRESVLRFDPCCYCGSYENWNIDHIVPVSRGGSGSWDNLTRACGTCNLRKKDKSLLEFLLARM